MKKLWNKTAGIILLLFISTSSTADQSSAKRSDHLIVAFGDSLTAGYGVSLKEAYPALLESRLKEKNYSYHVLNAGISGDTTSGGLSRINEIIKQNPEIVILELGANDGLRGTPIEIIKRNLTRMIEKLQKKGIKVLLAGMRLPPNYGEEYTQDFHQLYFDLAKTYHIRLIPFFLEGTAGKEGFNQADGLHPTADGYKIILENIWKYLEPLLHNN